MLIIIIISIIK